MMVKETVENGTGLNARQMLVAVMQDVQGVGKNDTNKQQGFKFRGIDAVVNAVGPALRKHGGFIVPELELEEHSVAQTASGGNINVVRLQVTYKVFGEEGPPVMGTVAAEAFDMGDKATAKAMSVAYRTFLLQALCLPTDEPDPDSESYEATPVSRDWAKLVAETHTVEQAKKLWSLATAEGASKEVLNAIQERGEELKKG